MFQVCLTWRAGPVYVRYFPISEFYTTYYVGDRNDLLLWEHIDSEMMALEVGEKTYFYWPIHLLTIFWQVYIYIPQSRDANLQRPPHLQLLQSSLFPLLLARILLLKRGLSNSNSMTQFIKTDTRPSEILPSVNHPLEQGDDQHNAKSDDTVIYSPQLVRSN